jgi:hypothetical protein
VVAKRRFLEVFHSLTEPIVATAMESDTHGDDAVAQHAVEAA